VHDHDPVAPLGERGHVGGDDRELGAADDLAAELDDD
jgi:hypothetical protein